MTIVIAVNKNILKYKYYDCINNIYPIRYN